MAELMPKVIKHFEVFIADITSGTDQAKGAFSRLVQGLVGDVFEGQGGVLDGLMTGFHALADLIVSQIIDLIPYVAEGLIALFNGATGLMTDGMPALGTDIAKDGIMPMTQEAFAGLMSNPVIDELGDAFMTMIRTFWDKYGDQITDIMSKAFAAILTASILQALPSIAIAGAIKGLSGAIMSGLGNAPGAGGSGAPLPRRTMGDKLADLASGLKRAIDELFEIAKNPLKLAGAIGVLTTIGGALYMALKGVIKMALEIQASGASPASMALAAAIVGSIVGIAYGVAKLVESMSAARLTPQGVGLAVAAVGLVGVMFAAVGGLVVSMTEDLNEMTLNADMEKKVQAANDLAMTTLKATAGIIGLGAVVALIASFGPVGVGIMLVALGASASIFYGVAKLIKSITSDYAG